MSNRVNVQSMLLLTLLVKVSLYNIDVWLQMYKAERSWARHFLCKNRMMNSRAQFASLRVVYGFVTYSSVNNRTLRLWLEYARPRAVVPVYASTPDQPVTPSPIHWSYSDWSSLPIKHRLRYVQWWQDNYAQKPSKPFFQPRDRHFVTSQELLCFNFKIKNLI